MYYHFHYLSLPDTSKQFEPRMVLVDRKPDGFQDGIFPEWKRDKQKFVLTYFLVSGLISSWNPSVFLSTSTIKISGYTYVKLSGFLLDTVDSVEQFTELTFHISTNQSTTAIKQQLLANRKCCHLKTGKVVASLR